MWHSILGDSCDSGIFVVLYMQIWDDNGLSRFVHLVRHAQRIYYLDFSFLYPFAIFVILTTISDMHRINIEWL